MRFYIFSFIVCVGWGTGATAQIIGADVAGDTVIWNQNTTVNNDVRVMPNRLDIVRSINLENHGEINTDIYVSDEYNLYVRNTGIFNANIVLGNGANLYQIISNAEQITQLNVNAEYDMIVDATDVLRLVDIANVAPSMGRVVLDNSILDINGAQVVYGGNWQLGDEVIFKIDSLDDLYGRVILENVSGNGRVIFQTSQTDDMFVDVGRIENNNLVVDRVRETDYYKILKNDVGTFLNNIRLKNPEDRLLGRLDAAERWDEIHNALSKSVRFNPDLMIRSMRVLNTFNTFYNFGNNNSGINLDVVLSDDFNARGINAGVDINWSDKLNFTLGVGAGRLDYASGVDEFAADYYTVNLGMDYVYDENLVVMGNLVLGKMDTDIDSVLYSGTVYSQPSVLGGNMRLDFGYRFNIYESGYLIPIIGGGTEMYSAESVDVSKVYAHAGFIAGYQYQMMGILYNLYTKIESTPDYGVAISGGLGFWSTYDRAGGYAEIAAMHAFDADSYKLSVGARMWF